MPTRRTATILFTASLLYLFANQTQVGWLYVMSALLAGVVLAAWWLNRRALRDLTGQRELGGSPNPELYESDDLTIRLTLRHAGRGVASQIKTTEHCILAAPESEARNLNVFVPSLPSGAAVRFDYDLTIYQRGVHAYPPLQFSSRAPFGFFRSRRTLKLPTRVLVYPEVRTLDRLSLLDDKAAPELVRQRAGVGSEVMGVRQYRTGDSPRHVHWRSVARTQQLISKQFAEEARPGLTIALDLFRHPYPPADTKHTPFEWAIKVAASIGDYAYRRNYPLYLAADGAALPPPSGAVTRMALLEYLARAQPTGEYRLPDTLTGQSLQMLVAAIIAWPDPDLLTPLVALRNQGVGVLAVLLDPESFPAGGPPASPLANQLYAAGLDVRLVRFGEDWAEQLNGESDR
ncbi:MAG: DUF58 domain-containing protein [Planctomycetota bacterium]|jgi:uncharacterized protein (DUF58 family)